MKTEDALKLVAEFKGGNLKTTLNAFRKELVGKGKNQIENTDNIFEAALEVKRISAQVDEVVHATGIIKCLPLILHQNETIENLSLASGAEGEGFDLVTNLRVAEFKFSRWQKGSPNGMRKRQVFADYVNLLILNTDKIKELYVFDKKRIDKYFKSKKAKWAKVLSKSGDLDERLENYLKNKNIIATYLSDISSIEKIIVIDIDKLLNA